MRAPEAIPYCGRPPAPDALWERWNLDPILIGILVAALGLYLVTRRRRPGAATWRCWAFVSGWTVLTLALVSPLCALSVSLFSARVGQHMILSLVAAPLLVLGWPRPSLRTPGREFGRFETRLRPSFTTAAVIAAVAFTLAIWFWHSPGPYAATFSSTAVYWLMHLTVIGTALAVWAVLLDSRHDRSVVVLATGAASTLQMTLLGALITLTPRLLYAPHALTPYAWGMTPSSDQQLGGLIMWVPGCTVFLGVTLCTLARLMSERRLPAALA